MYRKKYCFLMIAIILPALLVAGCSGNQRADDTEKTEKTEETIIMDTVEENSENIDFVYERENTEKDALKIYVQYDFSEGKEWIKTRGEGALANSYVCVDKEGNALFAINDSNILSISPFSNGYSFIKTDNAVYQMDSDGNIINSYMESANVTVKAYENGQAWMEEYNSDFNSAGYVYTLYNAEGKIITEFSVEGTEPIDKISYCGNGVWRYDTLNDDRDWIRMYYCSNSDKWMEVPSLDDDDDVYFYEDTAVLGLDHEDPDETGYRAKMFLMDAEGNSKEVRIAEDLGWNWTASHIKEGYCILKSFRDQLVSYNVSSGEFRIMNNEYAEKIKMSALPDQLMFTDGYVALPLIGNDEKDYVGIFDTSWNIIGNPIQCERFSFSDGRLIIEQSDEDHHMNIIVYDAKGVQIFNASEKGYATITSYKDGVAYVSDSANEFPSGLQSNLLETGPRPGNWKCINENGEYLFSVINTDNVKMVELQ